MFIIYCMQKLIAQPDNSKCRYTHTPDSRRREDACGSVWSVTQTLSFSVDQKICQWSFDTSSMKEIEAVENPMKYARHYSAELGWAALVIISTSSVTAS